MPIFLIKLSNLCRQQNPLYRRSQVFPRLPSAKAADPPVDPYDGFLVALERRIAEETDESQRSRLRRVRDTLAEMGKAAAVGLAVEMAKTGILGR